MFNATFAYRLSQEGQPVSEVYATATNLPDELAYSHASFVKEQSPSRGRNLVLGFRHHF